MENSEIIWTGSPDDQTARINDYVLRVEQMTVHVYWTVRLNTGKLYSPRLAYGIKESIDSHRNFQEAKTACEKAYYEHLKTR